MAQSISATFEISDQEKALAKIQSKQQVAFVEEQEIPGPFIYYVYVPFHEVPEFIKNRLRLTFDYIGIHYRCSKSIKASGPLAFNLLLTRDDAKQQIISNLNPTPSKWEYADYLGHNLTPDDWFSLGSLIESQHTLKNL
jgi:hypothetical protein